MRALTTVPLRTDAVEQLLGDPYDPANPYGFHSIRAAHEAGRSPAGLGELLDSCGLVAGRPATGELLEALRAVTRRSPRLIRDRVPGGTAAEAARIGAVTGALDSALRMTVRHLRARRLYGEAAIEIPQLRSVLAGVFADLLLCDALTSAAVRGPKTPAEREGLHAEAVRTFVPRAVMDALDRLSVVLGAWFYIRQDERAVVQVLLHDTQQALFGAGAPVGGLPTAALAELLQAPHPAGAYEPDWFAAAPSRRPRAALPMERAEQELFAELLERYTAGRSFDLADRPLPDRP